MSPENLSGALRQELQRLNQRAQEISSQKQAIENLLKAYSAKGGAALQLLSQPEKPLSTLEMAQEVLRKRGSEMKPEEIRLAIRQQFAHEAAPTLAQMLYTRARRKKMFYRNSGGRFGLIAWQQRGRQKKAA